MKFVALRKPSGNKGSALLAALCFCAVLGIALASYTAVCYQTLQASSRNSNSTHSLELAEIGMEEALWALNHRKDSSIWAANAWTVNNSSSPKVATKTIDDFSFGNGVTGAVNIEIQNYDGTPATLKVTGITMFADSSVVTRRLEAIAKPAPLFVNAVAAVNPAILSDSVSSSGVRFAYGGTVESKDSADSLGTLGYSAVVSSTGSVLLVSPTIRGYVAAAAATSSNNFGSLQIIPGSQASVVGPSSSTRIDPARLSGSPYQPVFDISGLSDVLASTFPSTSALALGATIGTHDATVPSYYFPTDLELSSSTLTIDGPVVLVVSGNFIISGSAKIEVLPGASLQVVMTGTNKKLSIGGSGIDNKTNFPKNVAIFAKNVLQVSDANVSTAQDFYGVIYAPTSDLWVSSNLKFWGSIVGKNVLFTGSPTVQYDVNLRRDITVSTSFSVVDTPFTVSSWKEITP